MTNYVSLDEPIENSIHNDNFYKSVNQAMKTDSEVIGLVSEELTIFGIDNIKTENLENKRNVVYAELIPVGQSLMMNAVWVPRVEFRYYAETVKLLQETNDTKLPNHTYLLKVAALRTGMEIEYI